MYQRAQFISHDWEKGFENNKVYAIQILCYGKYLQVKWTDKNGVTSCHLYSSMKELLDDWNFFFDE